MFVGCGSAGKLRVPYYSIADTLTQCYREHKMITQSELHALFYYNRETGNFIWKVSRGKRSQLKVGTIAGYTNKNGYKFIRLNKKLYRSHRLAWLYTYGEFPENEIDHIDGNPSNNAISNLRLCNSSQNKFNTKKRKDNTSGIKGVHWYKKYGKWQVNLNFNKTRKSLGYFSDLFEACCVITSTRNKLHKEFSNHGNS